MGLPDLDLYAELGVDAGADRRTILVAYRRAAKATHPDVSAEQGATVRMARVNYAREVLGDPVRRADYDRERRHLTSTTARPARTTSTRTRAGRPGRASAWRTPPRRKPSTHAPRAWQVNDCPVCDPRTKTGPHCALGHVGAASPRFGRAREFTIDPAEHDFGRPLRGDAALRHDYSCGWFSRSPAGPTPGASWVYEPDLYPAVGRIRKRDGITVDPGLLDVLERIADEAAVRDSLAYAVDGRVVLLAERGGTLAGLVCGRHPYNVRVALGGDPHEDPPSSWECTCPSYRSPCKHVLAAWIVWWSGALTTEGGARG